MAATPDPQPGHPLVQGLDKVFTGKGGNAPALVGWLSYLTHPDDHDGPRLMEPATVMDGPAVEARSTTDPELIGPDTVPYVTAGSIMRDLEGRSFFAHADVLTGQRVGELNDVGVPTGAGFLSDTYFRIEEVRYKKQTAAGMSQDSADVWEYMKLQSGDSLFTPEVWGGTASGAAKCRYDHMVLWYQNHRNPALSEMVGYLVRYAGLILKARMDINALMGKLVKSLQEWVDSEPSGVEFLLSNLRQVVDFAMIADPVSGGLKLYDIMKEVVDKAKNTDPSDFSYTANREDGCYQMLASYIKAGNQVLERTADAIDELVDGGKDVKHQGGIKAVRGATNTKNWVDVPDWNTPCQPLK
jgi:hypothetical protein